jgi:UDP-N-acetylmuramoyl-L-alanyl-D-glutamate--2,6-diaminopimelate ligase
MKISEIIALLEQYSIKSRLNEDFVISRLSSNIDQALNSEAVFYNLQQGESFHRTFLERLKSSDAGLIIINSHPPTEIAEKFSYIIVDHDKFLESQKELADRIYPYNKKVKIIGVTGTNGKTTIVNICTQLMSQNRKKSLSVGTLGICTSTKKLKTDFSTTSPSYIQLRELLHRYSNEFDFFFIEASSHALVQNRFFKLKFDAAAWSNFSQDHLDYHKTIENYFKAKLLIVTDFLKSKAPLFVHGKQVDLIERIDTTIKFSREFTKIVRDIIIREGDYHPFLKSAYNRENLALAYALVQYLLGGEPDIKMNLITPPAGRFDIVKNKTTESYIIVDYAHTPDAIKNILKEVRSIFPGFRLITLFGCGGDRDKTKRPLMGKAAEIYSNELIITSDNPRSEDPQAIVEDIVTGLKTNNYLICLDRKEAITRGIERLDEKSIFIILGKGHENYQEVLGKRVHFDDKEVVLSCLKEREK